MLELDIEYKNNTGKILKISREGILIEKGDFLCVYDKDTLVYLCSKNEVLDIIVREIENEEYAYEHIDCTGRKLEIKINQPTKGGKENG